MRLTRIAALLAASALAMLLSSTNANAAAVACGGGVSSGPIGANGCISAERGQQGPLPIRDIKAHVVLRNTSAHAARVDYEAFLNDGSGNWAKIGNGRTSVGARSTIGPIEIGSQTRVCAPHRVEIRVHVKPAGGAWSNWTSAATSQCQT
ncbi:hypothetical protein SAMN05421504_1011517 [Amycolatopsis xylanica]|uniref:Secreted protein n=1 Tax=Amycolatopsis xylanica TaxID=589385 RepID=A0A1H2WEW1_9PSEU|nr:hypothetical protein [Amycolatopsis xylanica]SDW79182.1 hypothetical protein SAMN05421504_1011517 [Amycolatopsis xylanica]